MLTPVTHSNVFVYLYTWNIIWIKYNDFVIMKKFHFGEVSLSEIPQSLITPSFRFWWNTFVTSLKNKQTKKTLYYLCTRLHLTRKSFHFQKKTEKRERRIFLYFTKYHIMFIWFHFSWLTVFWFVCFSEIVLFKDGLECAIMQTLSLWDHLLVTCKNSSRKYKNVFNHGIKNWL